jgi:hypothetical protein
MPGTFKGGKQKDRDSWFGVDKRLGGSDFKHWWHRSGKDQFGGEDLKTKKDVEEAYAWWEAEGRPKVK